MSQAIVILTTASSKEEGTVIAKVLVQEQLAACVNIIDTIHSFYMFEGSYCEDEEVQLMIKTSEENFEAVEQMIKELHSYKVPEIIALPIVQGSKDYMLWLQENC